MIFHFSPDDASESDSERMHTIRFQASNRRIAKKKAILMISAFFQAEGIRARNVTRGAIYPLKPGKAGREIGVEFGTEQEMESATSGEPEGTWL